MKTDSEIKGRIRHLLLVELDHRVDLATQRLPGHCTHNYRHPVDVRKRVDGEVNADYNRISLPVVKQTLGLCTLGMEDPKEWNGTICEDPIDAQRCPYFTSRRSKEDVQADFEAEMRDPEWLNENLPEVYGLLWTVGEIVRLPLWKRVLFWFLRIRIEPLKEVPTNLLLEENE